MVFLQFMLGGEPDKRVIIDIRIAAINIGKDMVRGIMPDLP